MKNVSREFKKINPTALVPVLVHNGEPHYDSWEIIKYLDAQAPEQGPWAVAKGCGETAPCTSEYCR